MRLHAMACGVDFGFTLGGRGGRRIARCDDDNDDPRFVAGERGFVVVIVDIARFAAALIEALWRVVTISLRL